MASPSPPLLPMPQITAILSEGFTSLSIRLIQARAALSIRSVDFMGSCSMVKLSRDRICSAERIFMLLFFTRSCRSLFHSVSFFYGEQGIYRKDRKLLLSKLH